MRTYSRSALLAGMRGKRTPTASVSRAAGFVAPPRRPTAFCAVAARQRGRGRSVTCPSLWPRRARGSHARRPVRREREQLPGGRADDPPILLPYRESSKPRRRAVVGGLGVPLVL